MDDNMTTCAEIYKILKSPEREKIRTELKKSNILRNTNGQKKLGYEIVALANRYGGKLIIGINDDGTFEGKGIFDIDKDRGIIDDICHTRISPVIEYSTEFLQCEEGDVLIVNVSKRKRIPHAYIIAREGPEIKNRIYYIRTAHGKRLVTDGQLQWLFKHQGDPDFTFPCRLVINYLKDSLRIPGPIPQPNCINNYINFVNSIPQNDIEILSKDWGTIELFFIEITPYALIQAFSLLFTHAWLIEVHRVKGRVSWRPTSQRVSSKKISVGDLPKPGKDSMIASLSWDFQKILESIRPSNFCVPLDTKLEIRYDNKRKKSQLSLRHSNFDFNIVFSVSSMGAGLHWIHPLRAVLMDRKSFEGQEKMQSLYQFIEIDCLFKASFNFPEEDVELFNEYYHYANTIKDHLENDWDYDHFIKELPHFKLYTVENKLNDILRIMEKKL